MHNKFTVDTTKNKVDSLLLYIKTYYSEKKTSGLKKVRELFPTFQNMSAKFQFQDFELRELLRELENRGEIERKVSQYYLRNTREQIIKKKEKPKKNKIINNIKINNIKMIVFKTIISFTVIAGIYISIYFTYLWFLQMFDGFRALCLSLFIVFSSLVIFEIFILFRREKYMKCC